MSEPDQIHERVDRLETEVAKVSYLARKADRDVSDFRAMLTGHTGVLNAIGETQREHGMRLADHGRRLERLERKVDDGFTEIRDEMRSGFEQANQNFATIEARFGTVKEGMDQITDLLTTALERPDKDLSYRP